MNAKVVDTEIPVKIMTGDKTTAEAIAIEKVARIEIETGAVAGVTIAKTIVTVTET